MSFFRRNSNITPAAINALSPEERMKKEMRTLVIKSAAVSIAIALAGGIVIGAMKEIAENAESV